MVARNNLNAINITRVYDAPVRLVWDAWTDPEQAAKWWGPRGFTLTTHSKDLRVGGVWHYTMHGPDGVDYPNKTMYHEVEEYKKLVYDHGGYDDRPPLFRVTVLFSESEGKTTMQMTAVCPTAEEAAIMRKFIKEAGGNATWDRLAEYLDENVRSQPSFVINRSFDVPVDQLFELWTDPAHVSHWLPPTGFKMEFLRADLREGGSCFFRMFNEENFSLYGLFDYQVIEKPSRIVYVQRFCDANEVIGRHPGLPVFPEAMRISIQFTSEGDRASRVTVTTTPIGNVSAEELAAFIDLRSSMTQGWTGSFDKLEMELGLSLKYLECEA